MKYVIVTGAAGFLGSHITRRHLDAGDIVMGLDNFSSSSPYSNHALKLKEHDNFMLYSCDITNFNLVSNLTATVDCLKVWKKWRRPDVIYNFACPASPPRYQQIPIETMLTCTVGTSNMLSIARHFGSVIVHASTSEVYGDPNISPQPEPYRGNVNSYGPRSCYDEGKRAAEALCYDYLNKHDVDARLVRIFNTYGEHMAPDDGRVVSNFVCQALRGEPLTLYGDGSQTRSLCYVSDLVDGIVRMAALSENPRTPVNIGNPNEFTVKELAEKVKHCFDGNVEFVYRDLPEDDPMQRRPDISLAKELLDFEPKVSLDEGLSRLIKHFQQVV